MNKITFENSAAQSIYKTALSRTVSGDGKELVDTMFQAAAISNGDKELSETEAKAIETALNKYDQGLLRSFGYVRYEDNEVIAAWKLNDFEASRAFEYQWQKRWLVQALPKNLLYLKDAVQHCVPGSACPDAIIKLDQLGELPALAPVREFFKGIIWGPFPYAPIQDAFEALSYFKDRQTIDDLFDIIVRGPFKIILLARSALVNQAAPKIVIGKLAEMLAKCDSFSRGEALYLIKYFTAKPEFNEFRDLIYSRTLKIFNDPKEAPSTRQLAEVALSAMDCGAETAYTMKRPKEISNVIFTTLFFRYPAQINWLVERVRVRANEIQTSSENIDVLSVGSSIGAEPLSIVMALLEDYAKNPAAWGNFDPSKRVKVIAADINLDALRYLQRGLYYDSFGGWENDLSNELGNLSKELRKKYFVCVGGRRFKFRDAYRSMLDFRQMDIVRGAADLKEQAFVVLYNNVTYYLEFEDKKPAAKNVFDLSKRYITFHMDGEQNFYDKTGCAFSDFWSLFGQHIDR